MNEDLYKNQMLNYKQNANNRSAINLICVQTIYVRVIKTVKFFDSDFNRLLLEALTENLILKIYLAHLSIKHSEISNIKGKLI
jgi:hypothetical protein